MTISDLQLSRNKHGFMDPSGAAELIPGMTVAKLAQMRFTGTGPRYYKPTPKTVVYSEVDLLEWLESTARQGTAEGY